MKTFTSIIIMAFLTAATAEGQYCTLPGRSPYSNIQPGITSFKLNTINRSSVAVESMSAVLVVTNDTTTLYRGHTYTVTIMHSRDSALFPTVRNNIRVWVDYNANSSFDDAGETVISSDLQTYGLYTNTFTVPVTAPLGVTRLRATVKMSSEGGHTLPTSCDMPADPLGYHGEMEDYFVRIAPTTNIPVSGNEGLSASLYPNPSNGPLTLAFEGISNDHLKVEVLDMTGRVLATPLNDVSQSQLAYALYLDQPNGVYMLRVTLGASASMFKVVKTN